MTPPLYTIIRTLLSTFTRFVTPGLTHMGIDTLHSKLVNLNLRESVAIACYIDKVAPEPNLHISLGHEKVIIEEQMWEFASLAGAHELMADEGYVFGSRLSWADVFFFLLLADLKAIPEGELLSPRMLNWAGWRK
ncbi:hypothetical protein DFJ58DRAFT_754440 [Suillus subalutaceus]|uniref:uncharacterized protein n=1 Tax=Suillus subalutaceus TaxID=48586 RepID=UPI001B867EAC|nr:uncharacterized protein DFJ58DRAFT_754440 [Suillus subalutaceus]KAG1876468.1 hypothetical protein DFJ58DRAFT_754440 [Suillus subalutaceus]